MGRGGDYSFEDFETAAKRARLDGYGGEMSPFNALEQAAFYAYAPFQSASLGAPVVTLSGQNGMEGGGGPGVHMVMSEQEINGADAAEQTAVLSLLNARTKRELSRLGLGSNPGSFQNLPVSAGVF